jgi:hypothetical protein
MPEVNRIRISGESSYLMACFQSKLDQDLTCSPGASKNDYVHV